MRSLKKLFMPLSMVVAILLSVFLIVITIELTFPCVFDCPYDSYYLEAVRNIGTINLAQERYFFKENRFATLLDKLKNITKIEAQTANYYYKIQTKNENSTFIYGIPRGIYRKVFFGLVPGAIPWNDALKLKSYVGAVFLEKEPLISSSKTLSIICKSTIPSVNQPLDPTYQNGEMRCSSGTEKSDEPYSTSIF